MTLREPAGEPPENENAPHIGEMGEAAEEHSKSSVRQPVLNIQEGQPTPNPDAACDFLQHWKPGGPWPLCAFHPDEKGNQDFETFTPATLGKLPAWIKKQAKARRNVYFHVNTVRAPKWGKAEKEDVMSMDWFHVDVDPADDKPLEAERQRIRERIMRDDDEALPPASVIIFSGGGYQGFWRQRKPIMINCNEAAAEDAELYNVQIAKLLGGDDCFNADRIMRLPGTVNWPNAKKRKRGQVPVVAELIRANWDVVYDIDQFLKAPPVKGASSSSSSRGGAGVHVDLGKIKRIAPDALENDPVLSKIESRAKVAIVQGLDPDQPLSNGNTRSDWLWHVACAMVRAGVDDTTMYAIITDPDLGISEHVLAAGNAKAVHRCAMRTIERAHEFAIDPMLAELNDEYAWVESVGAKARIMRVFHDPALEQSDIEFLQKDGFLTTYSNRFIETPKTDNTGKTVGINQIPVGKWWLTHPLRRSYKTVTFAPGEDVDPTVLNLWTGFEYDPKPGDCSKYLAHLKDNVCQGDQARYDYLIGWMANAVQHPGDPGQVAVVIRGGKGTGKNETARHFGELFGRHCKEVTNPAHVMGNFNATLKDAVVIVADECFVPKKKEHESALKAMITNSRIAVEMKGVDAQQRRNCTHLMMLTNDEWAVPATGDERRFLVLDIGTAKQRDRSYFGAIDEQMRNGGYEALLHFLMHHDLSGFDVTAVPETEALNEQKNHNLDGTMEGEWLECLMRGEMQTGRKDQHGFVQVSTTDLLALWEPRIGSKAAKFGPLRTLFVGPQGNHKGQSPGMGFEQVTSTPRGYTIPTLAECRRLWNKHRWPVKWDDPEAEWTVVVRIQGGHVEMPKRF